jgi:hypothetical protein
MDVSIKAMKCLVLFLILEVKKLLLVDGVSLEQELLDNELAYEYSSGKKLSWCK